jgi:hypothetical protein
MDFDMNQRIYMFPEYHKETWGEGPWLTEPDKIVWVDDETDLDCMIVRNRSGALCGYVGVPEGHPWHGSGYDDIEPHVHGGLTFAGFCEPGVKEEAHAICHTVLPGRPEKVWWLGFDCVHALDLAPAMSRYQEFAHDDIYRNVEYVEAEVARLAQQVRATI